LTQGYVLLKFLLTTGQCYSLLTKWRSLNLTFRGTPIENHCTTFVQLHWSSDSRTVRVGENWLPALRSGGVVWPATLKLTGQDYSLLTHTCTCCCVVTG